MAVSIVKEMQFDGRCNFCGTYFLYENMDDVVKPDKNAAEPDRKWYVPCPKCGKKVTEIWHNGPVRK